MANTNSIYEDDLRSIREKYLSVTEDIDKILERDGRVSRDINKIRIEAISTIYEIDAVLGQKQFTQEAGN